MLVQSPRSLSWWAFPFLLFFTPRISHLPSTEAVRREGNIFSSGTQNSTRTSVSRFSRNANVTSPYAAHFSKKIKITYEKKNKKRDLHECQSESASNIHKPLQYIDLFSAEHNWRSPIGYVRCFLEFYTSTSVSRLHGVYLTNFPNLCTRACVNIPSDSQATDIIPEATAAYRCISPDYELSKSPYTP